MTFAQPIPPEDVERAAGFVREMGWVNAYSNAALEAAVAAVQEEFDEHGLGDATLIVSVALDAAYEVDAPKRSGLKP